MILRILLLTGWLMVPVAGFAWHMGPGQERKAMDVAAAHIAAADRAVAEKSYVVAIMEYEDALKALPTSRKAESRKIRLEKAKAQMLAGELPEAHADLKGLVDELTADSSADGALLADARSTLANSQYYVTWLMRLEGMAQAEWEPEIEAARQTYKLLAEDADKRGDSVAAAKHREDLEASVRLARMELSELQGLNLPKQCKGCCSCKSGRKSPRPAQRPNSNDIRSAGGAPPFDDSGH